MRTRVAAAPAGTGLGRSGQVARVPPPAVAPDTVTTPGMTPLRQQSRRGCAVAPAGERRAHATVQYWLSSPPGRPFGAGKEDNEDAREKLRFDARHHLAAGRSLFSLR